MKGPGKEGVAVLGLGAAACVACCAGPILAFLGGIGIAGIAGTWLVGGGGLVIAALAAIAFLLVRHRQRSDAATDPSEPTPVELTVKVDR
jgi:mercuric ion transport protein